MRRTTFLGNRRLSVSHYNDRRGDSISVHHLCHRGSFCQFGCGMRRTNYGVRSRLRQAGAVTNFRYTSATSSHLTL
ncbi:protein of unknown function [Paraburkholderia kururiensis]